MYLSIYCSITRGLSEVWATGICQIIFKRNNNKSIDIVEHVRGVFSSMDLLGPPAWNCYADYSQRNKQLTWCTYLTATHVTRHGEGIRFGQVGIPLKFLCL